MGERFSVDRNGLVDREDMVLDSDVILKIREL